jgi:hypothetical protein
MKRPAFVAAIADTIAGVALVAWVGGHVALGAFAARIAFRDLPRPMASSTMTTIFRDFDQKMIVPAMLVLVIATLARVLAVGMTNRADRIAVGAALALLALGGFELAYVHPQIEQLFLAGRTLEPVFASLHKLSARCANVECLLVVAILGAQAFARRRA